MFIPEYYKVFVCKIDNIYKTLKPEKVNKTGVKGDMYFQRKLYPFGGLLHKLVIFRCHALSLGLL